MATQRPGLSGMDSLTGREMALIAAEQREAGVQRLSRHFSWPEFCDDRRCFHQEFVYEVAMFAAACGFPWPAVIQAAGMAKRIFPQLDGRDTPNLLSLLRDELSEHLPNLTSIQRREFSQFLTDTCTTRRRLFQAVVAGAKEVSITQIHLEVQLPPSPCPLAQGMNVEDAALTSALRLKEEELKMLREGSRFMVGEVKVPEDEQLDKEGLSALIRAAVKTTEDQVLESLTREACLLNDILQLKLQKEALAIGGRHPHINADTK